MNSSLGKYQAYNTFVHRLDPRIKLITMLLFMVSIFMSYSENIFMDLVIYGGVFVLLFILGICSKVSFFRIFRSLIALWVMILFVMILNVFFTKPTLSPQTDPTPYIAFSIGSVNIYWLAIVNLILVIYRLALVIMITNIFTSSTKPMEMTNALEWLFYPLTLIHIPVQKFAMMLSLALRFIPTLQEETERIIKAQASRGVDYKQGRFKEKIRALIALIIPLFMAAFTTSGQLADAMEARGYDPDAKRTRFKTNRWTYLDTCGVLFALLLLGSILVLAIMKPDMFAYFNIPLPMVK